jgi:hypothetical protein
MAYVGHNRLQIIGSFDKPERQDVWTVNLNFGGDLRPEAASAAQNAQIASIVETWWTGVKLYASQGVYLDGFAWNAIGPDGRYVTPQTPNTYWFSPSFQGTPSLPKQGPDSCLVVSLYTPKKGKRYRGRLFLPLDALTIDAGWNINAVNTQDVRNATATMIRALNTTFGPAPNGQGVCVVASQFGVNTPVTELKTGNMLDHQGRRRNRMDEFYTSLVL